jgi:hypothetical protein
VNSRFHCVESRFHCLPQAPGSTLIVMINSNLTGPTVLVLLM